MPLSLSPVSPARHWPPIPLVPPAALDHLPAGPLAVHIDFTDAPLAEDTGGRNTGPTLGQTGQALTLAARDPRVRALSIGELNPTRSAGDPDVLLRFADSIARILAVTGRG
jgi:arginase